ncbi:MAG: CDP-alcohol phosphatidyltransferase family protein [Candidatus Aenigmarchaeota archaeon]|nr:CDP-alcohol phosphatidyltransferase family protein [Candidatus Aenigmarchaeota archaeon]
MLYRQRERFNKLSVKVGIIFSRLGLSPNQWTLLTLLPTFAALYFLVREQFLLSAAFFIIASFIDLIDGSVARVTGNVTKLGAYLDTIIDRYVEGIIIIGLLFVNIPGLLFPSYFWLFIYFFGSMMTTYAKAAAKEKEIAEIKGGFLERAERLILLFAGIVAAHFSTLYLSYAIILLAVLTNISAVQRILAAAAKS